MVAIEVVSITRFVFRELVIEIFDIVTLPESS
jgi:hypothetical protein